MTMMTAEGFRKQTLLNRACHLFLCMLWAAYLRRSRLWWSIFVAPRRNRPVRSRSLSHHLYTTRAPDHCLECLCGGLLDSLVCHSCFSQSSAPDHFVRGVEPEERSRARQAGCRERTRQGWLHISKMMPRATHLGNSTGVARPRHAVVGRPRCGCQRCWTSERGQQGVARSSKYGAPQQGRD